MASKRCESVWDPIEASPPEAPGVKLRAEVAIKIVERIRQQGLTQAQAAKALGVTQPRVSDLMRGHLNLFSLDTLLEMARALGFRASVSLRRAA